MSRMILFRLFVISVLVFGLMGYFLYDRIEHALLCSFDSELDAYEDSFVMLSNIDDSGRFELDFSDEVMSDFSGLNPQNFFSIIRVSDGVEMERSRSLRSLDLQFPFELNDIRIHEHVFWNIRLDGKNVRCVAFRELVLVEHDEDGEEMSHSIEETKIPSVDPSINNDFVFIVGKDRREIDIWLREIALLSILYIGGGLFFSSYH